MKSTEQRDIYAEALSQYRLEVPVEKWPIYKGAVSRSGLERALKARGFERFERKRLDSSRCQPILKEMDGEVRTRRPLLQPGPSDPAPAGLSSAAHAKEIRGLKRRIEDLEKALSAAKLREQRQRERLALLEIEVEEIRRQRGAFEEHCHGSLRTLHV